MFFALQASCLTAFEFWKCHKYYYNAFYRLGKLMRAESIEEILCYCEEFFPGEPPEYFFDRNPDNFPQILDMYRSVSCVVKLSKKGKVWKSILIYWWTSQGPHCSHSTSHNIDWYLSLRRYLNNFWPLGLLLLWQWQWITKFIS